MKTSPIKKQKVSVLVLEKIKELIKNGTFPAGTKLPAEDTLAKKFQVSRASVREAISALAAIGIVESNQGGGNWIKAIDVDVLLEKATIEMISIDQVQELLDFRIIIETEAAALAAVRRTEEDLENLQAALEEINKSMVSDFLSVGNEADYRFHNTVVRSSDNSFLIQTVENIAELYLKLMKFSLEYNIGLQQKREEIYNEHEKIYEAIKEKDPKASAYFMKQHLLTVKYKLNSLK